MNTQVVKYPILGLDRDGDDYSLQPGWCRSIRNGLPLGLSSPGGIANVPGTVARTNSSLPAGTNTFIGHYVDTPNNRIFYFVHNSNADHGIWYYTPISDTHTKVLQSSYLGFTASSRVTGISVIEDILNWSDRLSEPRSLVVSKAVANFYNFGSQDAFEKQLSLYKVRPVLPPTVARNNNASILVNNISSDSFQFCTRYVYYDNTVSKPGPLSKLSPADLYPKFNAGNNYITVTQAVDTDIKDIIKKIQFLYVKNNTGDYTLFKESDSTGASSYAIDFYNTETIEVLPVEEITPINFIPNISKNNIVHEQRLIVTSDQSEYDDVGNFSFGLATSSVVPSTGNYHLPGSTYTYGVVFFDKFGRTNGVVKKTDIYFPKQYSGTTSITLPSSSIPVRASWTLSGTPPSWAFSYAIVAKKNNTVSEFFQTRADVFFYKRELGDVALQAGEFEDDGKVFYRDAQANVSSGKIYFRLPNNVPFGIDDSYIVRLLRNIGQTSDTEPIIEVYGNKIVCGNFGITDWTSLPSPGNAYQPVIQIEKYKSAQDEFYFETGDHYLISSGAFSTTSGTLQGDLGYKTLNLFFNKVSSSPTSTNYVTIASTFPEGNTTQTLLTPSPTTSRVTLDVSKTGREVRTSGDKSLNKSIDDAKFGIQKAFVKATIDSTDIISTESTYTLDYNKIASDYGRAWIEIRNKKVNYDPTILSISDKYVYNSQINGLSNFVNQYTLPPSRTPIRKLINPGTSNILLAIHERSVTSLASYSGDNILHTSDGSQLLGDGKSIFGYDRELAGGYGTIYPDSVVKGRDGRVYFFDPYKGEVLRYANGLTPIGSTYKMGTFFRDKGQVFLDSSNGRNVIGGFDEKLDMVYFTFVSDTESERETVAFIDRPGQERWFSFYDYAQVTGVASANNRLFIFYNGQIHEANVDSTYNNLLGTQYDTEVDLLFNTEPSKDKQIRNIAVEGDHKVDFPTISTSRNQTTKLYKSNFVRKDDMFYADVKRNANTPVGMLPVGKSAIVTGQPLIGKVFNVTLNNDETEYSELHFVNFGYLTQPGHRIR